MGRPPKYTPEELEKKIDEYFKDRLNKDSKINFCSIRDLCFFLDVDRTTFYRMKNRPGYATITKKAEDLIMTVWEQQLFLPGRNTTGAIFYLKNFGEMADKVEHQHSGKIEHQHTARLEDLETEQLERLTSALEALEEKENVNVIDVTEEEGE